MAILLVEFENVYLGHSCLQFFPNLEFRLVANSYNWGHFYLLYLCIFCPILSNFVQFVHNFQTNKHYCFMLKVLHSPQCGC